MNDEMDEINGLVWATRTVVWDIKDLDDPVVARSTTRPRAVRTTTSTSAATTCTSRTTLPVCGSSIFQTARTPLK